MISRTPPSPTTSLTALSLPFTLLMAVACGADTGNLQEPPNDTGPAPVIQLTAQPTGQPTAAQPTASPTNPSTQLPPASPTTPTPAPPNVAPTTPINPLPTTPTDPEPSTSPVDQTEPSGSSPDTDTSAPPSSEHVGFHIDGSRLLDVNGNEFIMRGVNYPYAWYKSSQDTEQRFKDIAATGANTVRVVMATNQRVDAQGQRWPLTTAAEVRNIIAWAKANKLVAMLEVHDSTGYDAGKGASTDQIPHPEHVIDYWLQSDILAELKGQEAYVLINIANEPFGNEASDEWQPFHEMAVAELREGGIQHTLIVDAPFWGQDWTDCMRDGRVDTMQYSFPCDAQVVFNADPHRNTMFATHMYDVYGTADVVRAYFDRFLSKEVPFLIGEFAADHGAGKNVDEATIMTLAGQHGIGYLGWSWSGNGSGLESLDITNQFNPDNLTTWGDRLINGDEGIKQTSVVCSCFD